MFKGFEEQKVLKIFGSGGWYFCWIKNKVMDTDFGNIIAVCWPVLLSFLYRMLNFQRSMLKLCALGPLTPAAPGCSCSPLLQPPFNSSRENWLWVHRAVSSSSWSVLLFSCSAPLYLPRLLLSLLDDWVVFTCPSCVCNILHNGILIHKRDCSKANNTTTKK